MEHGVKVRAIVRREDGAEEVTGTLRERFLVENGRVLIQVARGVESVWVDASAVLEPETIVLRSELWEVPDSHEREMLLRSLAGTLASQAAFHSYRIDLARQSPGSIELLFYNAVDLKQGAAYQASFAPIRTRCLPRPVPWSAPQELLATRLAAPKERFPSHIGHLPLWLESRHLWSVYLWLGKKLVNILQFSLNQRLQSRLEARFKLKPAGGRFYLA